MKVFICIAFASILSLSLVNDGYCKDYFNIKNEQELMAFGFSLEHTLTRIDEIKVELHTVTDDFLKNRNKQSDKFQDEFHELVSILLKIHDDINQMVYVQKFIYYFLKYPTNDWEFLNNYLSVFHAQCSGHTAEFQTYLDNGWISPQYNYILRNYINIRKQFDEYKKKFLSSQ